MPMPLAASSVRGGTCVRPAQRVLEDRQQTVEEQRDEGRLLAEAHQRHRQRQHRDGRKGLADIHEAARQRQELGARGPRDEDAERHRQHRAGERRQEDDAQMRQRQGQQAALVVDRRRVVLGQRREREGEDLRRREERHEQEQRRQPQNDEHAHSCGRPPVLEDAVDADPPDERARCIGHRQGLAARPDQLRQRIAQACRTDDRLALGGPGLQRSSHRRQRQQPERPLGRADQLLDEVLPPDASADSAGVAYCSSRASSITAIRSPRWNASSMSWVTRTMVVPNRRWIASRSSCALPRMTGRARRTARPSAAARARPRAPARRRRAAAGRPRVGAGTFAANSAGIELEQVEQLLDPGRDARLVPAEQARHGGDVLGDGAVREQAVALDGVADAAAQLVLRDRRRVLRRR